MKLNEVPTDLLKESLLAIADLRRKYTGEEQVTQYKGTCPICYFDTLTCKRLDADEFCTFCPWTVIEGHHCGEFPQNDMLAYDDFPIPDRLKRIDRWEAEINAEIARREVA